MFRKKDPIENVARAYLTGSMRKMVSEQAVRDSLDNIEELKHFREIQFEYMIIDQDLSHGAEDIPIVLSQVIGVINDHRFYLGEIASPLIYAYAGILDADSDAKRERQVLANELVSKCGQKIRILHGRCAGFIGYLDSLVWGRPIVCMAGTDQALTTLFALKYGECNVWDILPPRSHLESGT